MKSYNILIILLTLLLFNVIGCSHGKTHISSEEGGVVGVQINVPLGKDKTESGKPLIQDEEALNKKLKGKSLSEVVKVLGNPTVKKPCEKCKIEGGYWYYDLESGISILVTYQEGKVVRVRVITEKERPKEL